ncbi:MAG: anhydro-N-acetylmuramic acid kinase [Alistipes sp.]|jgi:anhydro-N-acetylmuramic acid kinase|nr:anhydro-N-acetylmuramic acid kinase [Alistipes sp.]
MEKEMYTAIGLMSGTSLDGLDIVCANFCRSGDGWSYEITHADSVDYTPEWRERLRGAFYLSGEALTALDAEYGRHLGRCVTEFVGRHGLAGVDFVASHGHTVFHRPDLGYNLQIGNGAHLHAACGLPVVCDFRTLDVAFGGQGAPLVPIGDRLLFPDYDFCLNIGGFANVSFDCGSARIAYDLCPANYTLNRLMRTRGKEYDEDGATARSGRVNRQLLEALDALEYYHRPPPKSLAQEWVDAWVAPLVDGCDDSFENIAATLTEHSARRIAAALRPASRVLVTGGGAYNGFLLERVREHVAAELVVPARAIVDFKEALIFAFLGLRRVLGFPNCLASVTGATHDVSSGVCYGIA